MWRSGRVEVAGSSPGDATFILIHPSESWRKIVGKLRRVQTENGRKIPLSTLVHRNISSSSSEIVGLSRSACQKSVPSPWYLSTASSGKAGGVFRQLFLQWDLRNKCWIYFQCFFYCISSVLLILYQLIMSSLLCHSGLFCQCRACLSCSAKWNRKLCCYSYASVAVAEPCPSNKSSALCQAALPGNIISCQAHVWWGAGGEIAREGRECIFARIFWMLFHGAESGRRWSHTAIYGVYSTYRKKWKERTRNDDGEGKGSRKYRRKNLRKECFDFWSKAICIMYCM